MKLFYILYALVAPLLVAAQCRMDAHSSPEFGVGSKITNENVCLSQGEGDYTFIMAMDRSSIGLPGSDVQNSAFYIADHTCTVLGAYSQPSCGTPYEIHGSFLEHIVIIRNIQLDIGSPRFSFDYANGRYATGVNQCGCATYGGNGFNHVKKACKCAFPVHGQ